VKPRLFLNGTLTAFVASTFASAIGPTFAKPNEADVFASSSTDDRNTGTNPNARRVMMPEEKQ